MKPTRASYQLTNELVARHGGGGVLLLDFAALGRSYRLHAKRPGAELNMPVGPSGASARPASSPVVRVDICGVIEQRAGFHDECGGWSDGHDAIAERMLDALEAGDVLLVIDSPGGAAAGIVEAVRRVQEAKAEHGRRVYAFADETIGSAAYWWATVADEIYLPPMGVVGSIGARAAHASVAGALEKEGVEVTHFTWPGEGKIAFAPELPLSDVGRKRGERDVALIGRAFGEAVAKARGLKVAALEKLNADCLTGEAAVVAGLADAVAPLEDVIVHALARAQENMTPQQTAQMRTIASKLGVTVPTLRRFGVRSTMTVAAAERLIRKAAGDDAWRAAKAASSPLAASTILEGRAGSRFNPQKGKFERLAPSKEPFAAAEPEEDEEPEDEDEEPGKKPEPFDPEPDVDEEPEPDEEEEEPVDSDQKKKARAKRKAQRAEAEHIVDTAIAAHRLDPAKREEVIAAHLFQFRDTAPSAPPKPKSSRQTVIDNMVARGMERRMAERSYDASFPGER